MQEQQQTKKMVKRGRKKYLLRKSTTVLAVGLFMLSDITIAATFDGTQGSHDTLFTNEITSKTTSLGDIDVLVGLDVAGDVEVQTLTIGGETFGQLSDLGAFQKTGNDASYVAGSVGIGTRTPGALLEISSENFAQKLTGNELEFNRPSGAASYIDKRDAGRLAFRLGDPAIPGSERLTLLNDGNVGIGTTSPTARLDVAGTIVADAMQIAGTILTEKIQLPKTGTNEKGWSIQENDIDNLLITYADAAGTLFPGKVGIGTMSPQATLEIQTPSDSTSTLKFRSGDSSGTQSLEVKPRTAPQGFYWDQYTTNSNAFESLAMTISSDGNVGIGAPTPRSKLDIQGDLSLLHSNSALVGAVIENRGSGNAELALTAGDLRWDIIATGTTDRTNNRAQGGPALLFIRDNVSARKHLAITADGKVGIGTTSPAQKLEITTQGSEPAKISLHQTGEREWHIGTHAANSKFNIHDATQGADRLTIDRDGRVGIGTSIPNDKLQIEGTTRTSRLKLGDTGGNLVYWEFEEQSDNDLTFTYGSEKVRVTSTGNVGIGTATPSSKLEVAGIITATDFVKADGTSLIPPAIQAVSAWQESNANAFRDTGNVGIGTTTPSQKLDVVGGVQVTSPEAEIKLNSPSYPHFISWTNAIDPGPTSTGREMSDAGGYFGWHSSPHTLANSPEYGGIDFGANNKKRVTQLGLIGHINPFKDFELQASDDSIAGIGDDGTWTTLLSSTYTNRVNYGTQEYTFSNPTAYRWYRIKVKNAYVGGWAMMGWELKGPGQQEVFTVTDSSTIRRIARATGLGPNDETDEGRIESRNLKIDKKKKDTALRIAYTDNLRAFAPGSNLNAACRWEIKVDGAACPGSKLFYDFYTYDDNIHRTRTLLGYCEGISPGQHEIQVWVGSVPDDPNYVGSDCYTGWRSSRWVLEAEEVY